MKYEFRWIDWNVEHIGEHGISASEAEYVVEHCVRTETVRAGEFLARGQTIDGRYIQVIYIFSPAEVVFVIHARPLTENEKRKFRRRHR